MLCNIEYFADSILNNFPQGMKSALWKPLIHICDSSFRNRLLWTRCLNMPCSIPRNIPHMWRYATIYPEFACRSLSDSGCRVGREIIPQDCTLTFMDASKKFDVLVFVYCNYPSCIANFKLSTYFSDDLSADYVAFNFN